MKNRNAVLIILLMAVSLSAGQNANAVISLDLDPSTVSIDTTYTAFSDSSTFAVALRINQMVTLKGYDIKINIDTSLFTYTQYMISDSYSTNILGPSPMNFIETHPDGIEIVASGAAVTASSGYLGTVMFKSKIRIGQSINLSLSYAEITDANMSLDHLNTLKGATFQITLPKFTLSFVAAEHGVITVPADPTVSITKDSTLQIHANADPGFAFLKWVLTPADAGVVGNLNAQTTTVSIVKNATLTAQFTPIVFVGGKNSVSNSGTLSVVYEKDPSRIRVVKNDTNAPGFSVSVIDLTGKSLIQKKNTGPECRINLTTVMSGVYILKITSESGNTTIRFRIP